MPVLLPSLPIWRKTFPGLCCPCMALTMEWEHKSAGCSRSTAKEEDVAMLVLSRSNTRGSPCSSQLIRTAGIRLSPPQIETLSSSSEKTQEAWKPSLIIFTRTLLLDQTSASHRSLGVGKVTSYGSPFLHIPISDGAGWSGDIFSHVLISKALKKCQGMTQLLPELILNNKTTNSENLWSNFAQQKWENRTISLPLVKLNYHRWLAKLAFRTALATLKRQSSFCSSLPTKCKYIWVEYFTMYSVHYMSQYIL